MTELMTRGHIIPVFDTFVALYDALRPLLIVAGKLADSA